MHFSLELLDSGIKLAFENGCRHIDGADVYGHPDNGGIDGYRRKMKEIISYLTETYGRDNYWITWKSDNITIDKIRERIQELDCGHIDLWLVHHSCGTPKDMEELKAAQEQGLIQQFGVSNCEDISKIRALKETYDIYANQIQARPPGTEVQGRAMLDENFISECYKMGVRCMLFGIYSCLLNADVETSYERMLVDALLEENIIYCTQKYVVPFDSVIILGIGTGGTLVKNINEINEVIDGKTSIPESDMESLEDNFKKIKLSYQ